jgi:hypothetical protein
VKIKNKLLSIFGILLFSCHPVTNPTYADVVEQDSIIFPVSSEKQGYIPCLAIADFSFNAMLAHQYGVSKEAQLSLAPVPTTQAEKDIKLILDEITYTAWQLNIVESKYGKAYLSNEFGKQVYLICVGVDWL